MEPSGKLYVPDAKNVAPAMEQLVDAARAAGLVHVASADDHELTDPEISDQPDFRNTYPPHCLRGTRGAEKILETKQRDPLAALARSLSAGARCRADRGPAGDPAAEEELQRLHESEHRAAARRARPGGDRRLRGRHGRLQRRRDPRLPPAGPARPSSSRTPRGASTRRGRLPAPPSWRERGSSSRPRRR